MIKKAGDALAAQFADTGYEWDTSGYVPLPAWRPGPIHGEDAEYDLFAITFKTAETNFAENMTIPVISHLTKNAAQTRGVLLNPLTAHSKGLVDGNEISIESRFGRFEGIVALTEACTPRRSESRTR